MSLEDLRAFLAVAEHGSFFSASLSLGVSRTTLRRQVEALESRTGVALLRRDRRGVVLTDAGVRLQVGGRTMERDYVALLTSVSDAGRPQGEVRSICQSGLPPSAIMAFFAMARASWPEMRMSSRFSDAPLRENLSDVDVVVWFGPGDPGPTWATYSILPVRMRLIASPSYLAEHGTPQTIADLQKHDVLAWVGPGETTAKVVSVRGPVIPIEPVMLSTNVDLLHECARWGHGIVWVPDGNVPPLPGQGTTVPVLEDLVGSATDLRFAIPKALLTVPKFKVVLQSLELLPEVVPQMTEETVRPRPVKKNASSGRRGANRRGS